MNTNAKIKLYRYIDLIIKCRWIIILSFCCSMIAGIIAISVLPRYYEAETLILVESKTVPDRYVKSVTDMDPKARVNTISEQVKSRSYLERIINDNNLYKGQEYANWYLEDKLTEMRKNISVKLKQSRTGGMDSFTISFRGKDPETVRNVVNSLASFFMDESIRFMEGKALETSNFLNNQLIIIRKQLEEHEEAQMKFREMNMGSLPEQLDSNLKTLERYQLSLSARQQGLRELKNRLLLIENQIKEFQISEVSDEDDVVTPQSATPSAAAKSVQLLDELKNKHAILLTRYTENHPEVVSLKKIIANLEAEISRELNAALSEANQNDMLSGSSKPKQRYHERMIGGKFDILQQYENTKLEISHEEQNIAETIRNIKNYEKRVEDTPKKEAELSALTRNYNNIKQGYDSLLIRKQEADMGVAMETQSKGEHFKIIDTAKKPQKPVSPDMKLIFFVFVAAGLGIGGGIIFLLDFFDSSIRVSEEAESLLGEKTPFVISIPKLKNRKDIILGRISLSFSVLFIAVSFFLFAGFGMMSLKGMDYPIPYVKKIVQYAYK